MNTPDQSATVMRRRAGGGQIRKRSTTDSGVYGGLTDLDIAVITKRDEEGERLIRGLQSLRSRVNHVWPVPEQIPVENDVVFCDLIDDLPRRLPWIPGEPGAALVILVHGNLPVDFKLLHSCAPHAVLTLPATIQAVQCNLMIAREHFMYERRLRRRIEKLDENLRTMRSVERAKTILMHSKSLSEDEAYHHLRRLAMEKRTTIGAVATAVVDSQELLG
ncbi:ANTAR domain-containing protein [Pelagibius litoralis]|uniref:ANTAR domain-containing protein n=1 Tax=Pelagibius litoralis TaxID=374515 RepID=A0A967EYR4_9PROT|nr:ANTAR domain-containing protein [Pelagibius litoralis]NIA69891.1 ANTAR domain-containing protein [Pelagibius litoralis]